MDLNLAASTDGDLKPAASNEGGDLEAFTYATVTQDGPIQECNSASKELFPIDRAVTANNTLSPTGWRMEWQDSDQATD